MRTQRETDLEDLIERLRYYKKQAPWSPCGKAADEIERLTTELEGETKRADGNLDALKAAIIEEKRLAGRIDELEDENKELDDLNYIQAGMIAEAGLAATEQIEALEGEGK